MKVNAQAKLRAGRRPILKATYEADYSHPAWRSTGEPPSPAVVPEAFYVTTEQFGRLPAKPRSARKQPHRSLSLTQLRKRLSAAGVRGRRISDLAREIKAGPGLSLDVGYGTMVMGWPTHVLEQHFGRRIARAVSKFVDKKILVLDEAWDLLRNMDFPTVLRPRRLSTKSMLFQQSLSDFVRYP